MAQAQNFGDRLIGSIGGVVIGIVVFIVSFVVLFNTEGRTDNSTVAVKAVPASEAAGSDFVFSTGELTAGNEIGDEYLNEGAYVAIKRDAQIFAWVEDKESDENDVDHYEYDTAWVDEPENSDDFNDKRGHENFPLEINDLETFPDKAYVGEYEIDPKKVRLPGYEKLVLNKDMVIMDRYSSVYDDYLFIGYGNLDQPEVGDVRIGYTVIKPGQKATVFGRPDGLKIEAHHGENEKNLFRVFWGTKEDAISQLKDEYKTEGWTMRIIGFVIMWIGLMLIFKPLSVAFELIPLLGQLGKSAVTAITFLAALILTTVTTLVSVVLHNPIGIAAVIIVIVSGFYFLMAKKQLAAGSNVPGVKRAGITDGKTTQSPETGAEADSDKS